MSHDAVSREMCGDHRHRRIATKRAAIAALALVAAIAHADSGSQTLPAPAVRDAKVYQTDKYGHRLGQAYEIKSAKVYQTDRYGNRLAQAYVVQGERIYQTDKYGNRLGQSYVIKDGKVYETDKYGNRRGQAFATESNKVYKTDRYGHRLEQAYEVKDQTKPRIAAERSPSEKTPGSRNP